MSEPNEATPDDALAAHVERAAEVRRTFEAEEYAPCDDDSIAFAKSGFWLVMYLNEVEEALAPLHVAGIAFPDADLPDELDALADRGAGMGLSAAVEHLGGLAHSLRGLLRHQRRRERAPWLKRAWSAMQHLVVWLRLMKAETSLLSVEGNLIASYGGRVKKADSAGPTLSTDVWPLGINLLDDREMRIYCCEIGTGKAVILFDQLAEVNDNDPMRCMVVSRFFQNAVVLNTVLNSRIRLKEQPVKSKGSITICTPGFKAVPELAKVSVDFDAPELDELELNDNHEPCWAYSGAAASTLQIGWIRAEILYSKTAGQPYLATSDGTALPMLMPSTLRLNLLKWLIGETFEAQLWSRNRQRFVVLVQDNDFVLLNMTTGMGDRVFPAEDKTLFGLLPEQLAKAITTRAEQARLVLLELMLKVEFYRRPDAVTEEQLKELQRRVERFRPYGIEQAWLKSLACRRIGASEDTAALQALALDTLRAAAYPTQEEVPEELLVRVLGRKPGSRNALAELFGVDRAPTSTAPLGSLLIFQALWLVALCVPAEEVQELCQSILKHHYNTPIRGFDAAEVCTRAVLMLMATAFDVHDPVSEDELLSDPTPLPAVGRRAGLVFLHAHFDDLVTSFVWTDTKSSDVMDIVLLTHAYHLLCNRVPGMRSVLWMPPMNVAERCMRALARFFLAEPKALDDKDFARTIKTMMMLDLGGIDRGLIG